MLPSSFKKQDVDQTAGLGGLDAVWGALAMKHGQQEPQAP